MSSPEHSRPLDASVSPFKGSRESLLSSSLRAQPALLTAPGPPGSLLAPRGQPTEASPSRVSSPSFVPGSRKSSPNTRRFAEDEGDSGLSRSLSRSIPVQAGTPSKSSFRRYDISNEPEFRPASYSRRPKKSFDFPVAFTPADEGAPALQSYKPSTSLRTRGSPREAILGTSQRRASREGSRREASLLSASVPRDVLAQNAGKELAPNQVRRVLETHLVNPGEVERKKILGKGLVQEPGDDMDDIGSNGKGESGTNPAEPVDISISAVHHQLRGGAIVDDIYKHYAASYQNSQAGTSYVGAAPSSFGGRAEPAPLVRRSSAPELPNESFSSVPDTISPAPPDVSVRDILAPGGMRRAFLQSRARARGTQPQIHTRNFIEFLSLYGHFGLLDPDDQSEYGSDESDEEEEGFLPGTNVEWRIDELGHRRRRYQSGNSVVIDSGRHYYEDTDGKILPAGLFDESQPLLGKRVELGTSPSSTFFILLKAFVGTGILFLPKAFSNGGLIFSLVGMVTMGLVSLFTMLILFYSSQSVGIFGAGYGDVAEVLFGRAMRLFVLVSVVVSQIGFGTAYMIFVAQNVLNVIWTLTEHCSTVQLLILGQVIIYTPIIWIRKLGGFSFLSLVADVFILMGVAYVCMRDLQIISREGPAWAEGGKGIHLGFGVSPPTFAGTAIFAYEGISLILPIANSMKDPSKFPLVLSLVMLVIGAMMILVGSLSYIAFGDEVTTVIFNAMPAGDPLAPLVQLLYALAIFFSFPLSIYPCVRILESWIFGTHRGKQNFRIKWLKNLFRAVLVGAVGAIAVFGSDNLDYFVSLVGSVTCIPLMFILPAAFDLKLTELRWRRVADVLLLIFGTVSDSPRITNVCVAI